jgi:hypothetical protein
MNPRDQLDHLNIRLKFERLSEGARGELEERARHLRGQTNPTTPKDDTMPAPIPTNNHFSEHDNDALHEAIFGTKPERAERLAPDDGKVRATDRLSLDEVVQMFPDAAARDSLLLAHKLGTPLAGDELRAAVALLAEEDRRIELDEAMRGISRRH